MEKLFKNQILNDLYKIREEGFEGEFIKEYGKPKEVVKAEKTEEKFTEMIKSKINNKDELTQFISELNEFEGALICEMCFWNEQYYKLGFLDAIYLKQEIKEKIQQVSKDKYNYEQYNSFFNDCMSDFMYYFEKQKSEKLAKREDYKELTTKIEKIKKEFHKVRTFIENGKIIELTNNEMKAVLEIIEINEAIETLEIQEAFKLGLKEQSIL